MDIEIKYKDSNGENMVGEARVEFSGAIQILREKQSEFEAKLQEVIDEYAI